MLIFNYEKYREFRKRKDNLTEEDLKLMDEFDHLSLFDEVSYDEMWKQGKIILKDWCDESK